MARSHSPSTQSASAEEISVPMYDRVPSQMDGACLGKPDGAEGPRIVEPEPPVEKMPKFLKLTPEGMLLKVM